MGVFYDKVLKMRENGRTFVANAKPKTSNPPKKHENAPKPEKTVEKHTTETAVKKNDKSTGGKA